MNTLASIESYGLLQEELEQAKDHFQEATPPEVFEIIMEHIKGMASSEIVDYALKEGDVAPDFLLPDTDGNMVNSVDLRAKGPLVVIFFRGSWCPYCNVMLRMIRKYTPHFEARGATVVAISPQTVENNQTLAKEVGITFPILADDHSLYAQSCNIAFAVDDLMKPLLKNVLPGNQGNDSWILPIPATYVIEGDSKISYAFVEADFTKRAEPIDILNALPPLKKLKRKQLQDKLDVELAKMRDTTPEMDMQLLFQSIEDLRKTGIMEAALKTGDMAPDFQLPGLDGHVYASKKLLKQGPLIVTFFQGHWNSFDHLTLQALQQFYSKFEDKGATLVAISPQTIDATKKSASTCGAKFPLLMDDGHLANKFRISYEMSPAIREMFGAEVAESMGDESYRLPLTSTYVIGQTGEVLYSHVSCDHTKRAEPMKILKTLPSKIIQHKRKRGPFSLRLGSWLPVPKLFKH
jgi:peroxiredoxin